MNKITRDIIILIVAAAILLFGVPLLLHKFVDTPQQSTVQTNQPDKETVKDKTEPISVTIQGLYTDKPFEITTDETVLQVLQSLNSKDANMRLTTKEYKGLGTLIDSINGMNNGTDNKYWQYKVNGSAPQIGADQFKLKADDKIEWYFAKSEGN